MKPKRGIDKEAVAKVVDELMEYSGDCDYVIDQLKKKYYKNNLEYAKQYLEEKYGRKND